jgi:hypothetical protein
MVLRGTLPAGAVAVLAPRPTARPALAFLQLLLGPSNPALSGPVLLGILDPADELVAGQWRYVLPGVECRAVGDQRLTQVRGQLMHHPTGHSLAAHRPMVVSRGQARFTIGSRPRQVPRRCSRWERAWIPSVHAPATECSQAWASSLRRPQGCVLSTRPPRSQHAQLLPSPRARDSTRRAPRPRGGSPRAGGQQQLPAIPRHCRGRFPALQVFCRRHTTCTDRPETDPAQTDALEVARPTGWVRAKGDGGDQRSANGGEP